MTDKEQALAEIGFNPKAEAEYDQAKYDEAKYPAENTAPEQRPLTPEDIQRRANRANHSERAVPMGRKFRY